MSKRDKILKKHIRKVVTDIVSRPGDSELEVELRLGHYKDKNDYSKFSTNIGRSRFSGILKMLTSTLGRPQKSIVEESRYKNARVRVDSSEKVVESIKKRRLKVIDIDIPGEFDMRVGMSKETKVSLSKSELDKTKDPMIKQKYVFAGDYADIELTKVIMDKPANNRKLYRVEIELKPSKITKSRIEDAVHEIFSQLKLLESTTNY